MSKGKKGNVSKHEQIQRHLAAVKHPEEEVASVREPVAPELPNDDERDAQEEAEAKAQPAEKPAEPAKPTSKYANSYQAKARKLPASIRILDRVKNNEERLAELIASIKRWGIDSADKQYDNVQKAVTSLESALDEFGAAKDAIFAIPAEWKPKHSDIKSYNGGAESLKEIAVGSTVCPTKKAEKEIAELLPDVDVTKMEVVLVRGSQVKVKLSDGTTALIAASKVKHAA